MTQNTFLVKVREVKQLHWKSGQMSGLVLGLSFQSRLNKKNKLKLYMSCKLTRLDVELFYWLCTFIFNIYIALNYFIFIQYYKKKNLFQINSDVLLNIFH